MEEAMDASYPPLTSTISRSLPEKHDLSMITRSNSSYSPLSSSSSSSSSSFSSSFSSISSSSSHQCLPLMPYSPFTSLSSSNIPFSWESQPGIPKAGRPTKPSSPNPTLLPLPPSRHHHRQQQQHRHRHHCSKEGNATVDPFAVALMKHCSKDDNDHHWKTAPSDQPPAKDWVDSRRKALGLISTFDLYASCKSASSVADSIYMRRPRRGAKVLAPAYDILSRRRPE